MPDRDPEFDRLAEAGVVFPHALGWLRRPGERVPDLRVAMDAYADLTGDRSMMGHNGGPAMDAQPTLATVGNAGVPALLSTMIDPEVVRIALAPLNGARILGESKRGDWTKDTIAFPVVEMTGEVSSYGDFDENGRAGITNDWPQRQSYFFQVIIEYGERELDRAGTAKLNYASELQTSAANTLNRFQDLTYHFGVAGLQNYGVLNDPNLPAALTPATKAAGGTRWINANGTINATPNEVYADVQTLYQRVVAQTFGVVEMDAPMKLVCDPATSVALTSTNNFNVSVKDLLKKNFPNLELETDFRYATTGGNLVQLIATQFNGADTGFCAYPEKLRQHAIIKGHSSYSQKQTSGTWGAVIRYPLAFAQLLGV